MRTIETRRLRPMLALVAATAMAVAVMPATANASPHLTVGDPAAVCDISGTVDNPNVDVFPPSPGSFYFDGTDLACMLGDKAGTYNADAWGDTTDVFHSDTGETVAQGGSTSYAKADGSTEYHTGKLTATGPKNLYGKIHFIRLGAVVLADGPIWDDFEPSDKKSASDQWFQAVVTAVPDPLDDFATSTIAGPVLIFNAGSYVHVCAPELAGKPNHKGDTLCPGVDSPLSPSGPTPGDPKDWDPPSEP